MIIKKEFAPITITLSTKEDLGNFRDILHAAHKHNNPYYRGSCHNQLQQVIDAFMRALE
jgi:hypothetical protein